LGVSKRDIVNVVIAYEPVWAIGKTAKDAMDSHKLHETTLFIRKTLTELYGRNIAEAVTIIYGGSVEPVNAPDLIKNGNVSGFLVGRASLSAKEFGNIIDAVEAV
jgi:triosephosphate isomerase